MYMNSAECRVVEEHEPEHVYRVTGNCVVTGEEVTVRVPGPEMFKLRHGFGLIQEAAPSLTPGEREFLKTGISDKGWKEMFGGDEEE